MNRTIKGATVKRLHYDSHDQLRSHLDAFVSAYNFARRLKTLEELTPYAYICKVWTSQLQRFKIDPTHQIPGLYTMSVPRSCRSGAPSLDLCNASYGKRHGISGRLSLPLPATPGIGPTLSAGGERR